MNTNNIAAFHFMNTENNPTIRNPKYGKRIISRYLYEEIFFSFPFLGKMVVTDAETIKYK